MKKNSLLVTLLALIAVPSLSLGVALSPICFENNPSTLGGTFYDVHACFCVQINDIDACKAIGGSGFKTSSIEGVWYPGGQSGSIPMMPIHGTCTNVDGEVTIGLISESMNDKIGNANLTPTLWSMSNTSDEFPPEVSHDSTPSPTSGVYDNGPFGIVYDGTRYKKDGYIWPFNPYTQADGKDNFIACDTDCICPPPPAAKSPGVDNSWAGKDGLSKFRGAPGFGGAGGRKK